MSSFVSGEWSRAQRLSDLLNGLRKHYSLRFFLRSGASQLALTVSMAMHDLTTLDEEDDDNG